MAVAKIAEVLNVEEKKFASTYSKRFDELQSIHKGLLVKAAYDNALEGDNRMLTRLLEKEGWLEDKVSDSLGELLKRALTE